MTINNLLHCYSTMKADIKVSLLCFICQYLVKQSLRVTLIQIYFTFILKVYNDLYSKIRKYTQWLPQKSKILFLYRNFLEKFKKDQKKTKNKCFDGVSRLLSSCKGTSFVVHRATVQRAMRFPPDENLDPQTFRQHYQILTLLTTLRSVVTRIYLVISQDNVFQNINKVFGRFYTGY